MYGIVVLFRSVVSLNRCSFRFYSTNNSQRLLEILANMPKANSARIAEAQRQRQLISKKAQNYGPSTVYLQVLGSGTRGAPNTLYLFTDQKRYLFNCGESTQRHAHEHKVKLTRLDHIFITNKTWKNLGGLPGLSLTLQDVGVPNITLHGPEGLDELYNATRRFVIMKDMDVTMAKCSPSEDFVDNVMTVKYVLLYPENILQPDLNPITKKPKLGNTSTDKALEEFTHDDTDYYRSNVGNRTKNNIDNKEKSKMSPEKGNTRKKEVKMLNELQGNSKCTVAYICTLKKRMGTLDLEKCVEKGVKPGPMLGQLKNGHDVILPDGTVVRSKDVKTPDDPGPVFIVLEVPDISYLRKQEFSAHFDNGQNPKDMVPTVIVHLTPPHVLRDPTYRAFMSLFGDSTKHLILNEDNTCLGSEAVHRSQHKLHQLDPRVFPLLRDVSVPAVWDNRRLNGNPEGLEEMKNRIALAQFQNIISMKEASKADSDGREDTEGGKLDIMRGRTLTMFHLRPKKELDRSAEPKLHIQDYIQESMDNEGFPNSLKHFHALVEKVRPEGQNTAQYPKVVFMGTGSCIPSKTRNTSGIVLQIDESRSMLMDCGEGTFGQLVRFYGPKRVNSFLRSLKAIYVSHLHADHHIGLIGLLQARAQAFESETQEQFSPLHLLAPGQIVTWLSLYDQQFERIRDHFVLVPNQTLLDTKLDPTESGLPSATLADMGVANVSTCLVSHCPNAFGVAIQLHGGHKITYSGDTIPCEELARIGQNSTLLIHEATMEDELAEEARTKMHSTTSQAIEMGKSMNARYTLLTHFSQRYARIPRIGPELLKDSSVGIAFDNMQVTMDDLPLLPHMYAPLQLMFAEHCVGLELKALNRAKRAKRSPSATDQTKEVLSREKPSYHLRNDILTHLSVVRNPNGKENMFSTQDVAKGNFNVKASRSKVLSPVRNLNSFGLDDGALRSGLQRHSLNCCDMSNRGPNRIISGFTSATTKEIVTNLAIRKPINGVQVENRQINSGTKRWQPTTLQSPAARSSGRSGQHSTNSEKLEQSDLSKGEATSAKHITNYPTSPSKRIVNDTSTRRLNRSPIVQQSFRDTRPRFNNSPRIESSSFKSKSPKDTTRLNSMSPNIERKEIKINDGKKVLSTRKKSPIHRMSSLTRWNHIEMLKSTVCRELQQLSVYEKIASKKPEPLSESKRREDLIKTKAKFKSKLFMNESKYTHIEGLNWISWK